MPRKIQISLLIASVSLSTLVLAVDNPAANVHQTQSHELPAVEVTAESKKQPLPENSTVTVDRETLFNSHVFTVNEALRKVPGVYVRDEEGFGIRPNIGIRGQNPFRSRPVGRVFLRPTSLGVVGHD